MSGALSVFNGTTAGLVGQAITTPNVLQSLVSPAFIGSLGAAGLGALGVGDLPNLILVLGGVPFFDFEVPETIHGGGEQAMHLHKYPGGARTVDTLGPDDAPLHWSGWFESLLAEPRARQLDSMRRQGLPIICSWSTYYYLVVVKKFDFRYNRYFHIGYDLELLIVQDLAAAQTEPTSDVDQGLNSAFSQASRDIGSALNSIVNAPSQLLATALGPGL